MPTRPRPVVALGLLVGILAISTSAILARIAMGDDPAVLHAPAGAASALAIAFWRTVGGALALTPLALRARRRTPTGTSRRDQGWLLLSGLALALHFALFQGALALTSVASAVTLATASPIFVAIGSWWLLREPVSARVRVGLVLTIAGAATIGVADAAGHDLAGQALLGDVMALVSALAMSAYLLIGRGVRPRVTAAGYSATVYAWAALALGAVCVLLDVPLSGYDTGTWLAIAGIVVGPQLLGHTVFNTLLARVSATVVAVAVLAEPLGAGLLAWLLFTELPSGAFWLGAPLVLLGVGISATQARRRRATGQAAAGSDAPPRSPRSRP